MTSEYKNKLQAYGVNLSEALDRFMDNEQLYDKFLSKFPMDKNFLLLEKCFEENNFSQTFTYAHTLKGLAGTLELEPLSAILIPMTDQLKRGDTKDLQEMFKRLKEQYELICHIISEH